MEAKGQDMTDFVKQLMRQTAALALAGGILAGTAAALEEASVIIETNAATCEVGLRVNWMSDRFRVAAINEQGSTTDRPLISTAVAGNLRDLGLASQANATATQVMDEIVAGLPGNTSACEQGLASPTGTLADFFADYPAGDYPFLATSILFDVAETSSPLTHVIPAPARIEYPREGQRISRFFGLVRWNRVEALIPTFPDAYSGTGITDADVDITGFELQLERLRNGGAERVLTAATDETYFWLPAGVLDRRSTYRLTLTQIDRSGNRTATEAVFSTR